MIQINKSRLTLLTTTAAALLIFSASALAFFTNGGFEGGDFAGWTKLVFTNTGLTGSAPFSGSNIQRGAGGVDRTTVATGATMSISDPIVPAVLYPRFGTHAALPIHRHAHNLVTPQPQHAQRLPGRRSPQ